MTESKERGLYPKYKVERVDGKPIPHGCIVLEFGDPIARQALQIWALEMSYEGYQQVHADVMKTLEELDKLEND